MAGPWHQSSLVAMPHQGNVATTTPTTPYQGNVRGSIVSTNPYMFAG